MTLDRLAAAVVAAFLVSCGKSGTTPVGRIASIQIVSGNAQTGFAGEELPDAVVVRVADSAGAPVPAQIINFKVTDGGGSVFAGAALSDANGMARERWTLGGVGGLQPVPQKLEARAVDSQSGAAIVLATFEATAIARAPTGLTYSANPATYLVGTAVTPNAPSSGGGPVFVYAIFPALPPGLVMNAAVGVITGTPTAVAATASYIVTATNSGGSATGSLSITVNPPPAPVITAQPASQVVSGKQTVTFSVTASGMGTLGFQWQKNGVPITGAGSASYSATPQSPADDGSVFTVAVSDAFGGITTSSPATLTVLPGFWPTGSMATHRADHTATLLLNGKVLVVGGTQGGLMPVHWANSAELYDSATGTFSATGSMATAKGSHTATLLQNGKVLVAGGNGSTFSGSFLDNSAELYDPATGTFSATGSMATAKGEHTGTLLQNGKVLVVGGRGASGAPLADAELYDPATGTFSATGSMATVRAGHTATLLQNGKVLVAGGRDAIAPRADAELYEPATGTFSATGSMATDRANPAATLLQNGKVLVVGGRGASGAPRAYAELYDPVGGSFSVTGSMPTVGGVVSATLLQNGKVLSVDESGGDLYDPATGTVSVSGRLATPRPGHQASLLQSGKVLVVGGYYLGPARDGDTLESVELYEP